MKLASLARGGRDGTLIVVSRDLRTAAAVPKIAATLQAALDDWERCEPELQDAYERLNAGGIDTSFGVDEQELAAPLPRAYAWLDGSAYVNHVELVRKARGAAMPGSFWTDPLMYQGGSDRLLGPRADIELLDEAAGLDFEAELAVITGDLAAAAGKHESAETIRLITLVNDVSLRNLIPAELAKGFGFVHGKPPTALGPVAVTPDELGDAYRDHKVHLPLVSHLNGEPFGHPDAGTDMTFDFATLVAHAARTRPLTAGTVIGSGTVSNLDRSRGSSCIAERRMLEKLETGEPRTPFMKSGDRIRIEMEHLGAIDQRVI